LKINVVGCETVVVVFITSGRDTNVFVGFAPKTPLFGCGARNEEGAVETTD